MEIILLERIANLGGLGDKISVKKGFARNYLVPQGKAKIATAANLKIFEEQRADLEKLEAKRLADAKTRAEGLDGKEITISHQAGEEGKLFGSVTASEVVEAISAELSEVSKQEVRMPSGLIRETGEYVVEIGIHSDVVANVTVKVVASS